MDLNCPAAWYEGRYDWSRKNGHCLLLLLVNLERGAPRDVNVFRHLRSLKHTCFPTQLLTTPNIRFASMSTRSKTRLAASSSTANPVPSNTHKPEQKSKTLSKSAQSEPSESDQPEKENVKVNPSKRANKTPPMKRKATKPVAPVHCTCNKGDDGSPMINCSGCKVW